MSEEAKKARIAELRKATRPALKNVRASFCNLIEPKEAERGPRHEVNLLIPKESHPDYTEEDGKNLKKVKIAMIAARKLKYGEEPDKFKSSNTPLGDGDEVDWDGYTDCWYVSCGQNLRKKDDYCDVRGKNPKRKIESEDDPEAPYSGCYINAVPQFYVFDKEVDQPDGTKQKVKRIIAGIEAAQFKSDGESFGATKINPEDFFEDESDGDGEIGGSFDLDEDDDLGI